jgi:hypothetical protein
MRAICRQGRGVITEVPTAARKDMQGMIKVGKEAEGTEEVHVLAVF